MLERDSTFDGCLQAGCSRPRTRFSAFCEEHHQRQLAGLESQGALRADEWEQVIKGPRWLQALRLAAGAIAGIYVHDRWRMTAICLAATIIVTLIGWERGARVFMRNDGKMALPVVYSPSVLFTIPLFVYSCVVILLGVIVVRLPHFYQPNGVSPSLLSLVRAETLAAMYVVPIYPTWPASGFTATRRRRNLPPSSSAWGSTSFTWLNFIARTRTAISATQIRSGSTR